MRFRIFNFLSCNFVYSAVQTGNCRFFVRSLRHNLHAKWGQNGQRSKKLNFFQKRFFTFFCDFSLQGSFCLIALYSLLIFFQQKSLIVKKPNTIVTFCKNMFTFAWTLNFLPFVFFFTKTSKNCKTVFDKIEIFLPLYLFCLYLPYIVV